MEFILKYFPELTEVQISRFQQLEALYHDWNSKITVISRKYIDKFDVKHVFHFFYMSYQPLTMYPLGIILMYFRINVYDKTLLRRYTTQDALIPFFENLKFKVSSVSNLYIHSI